MKIIAFFNILSAIAYCTTAYFIVERVADTYERSAGICPGPLGVNDYYTPGE